jgi:hypothetical protein
MLDPEQLDRCRLFCLPDFHLSARYYRDFLREVMQFAVQIGQSRKRMSGQMIANLMDETAKAIGEIEGFDQISDVMFSDLVKRIIHQLLERSVKQLIPNVETEIMKRLNSMSLSEIKMLRVNEFSSKSTDLAKNMIKDASEAIFPQFSEEFPDIYQSAELTLVTELPSIVAKSRMRILAKDSAEFPKQPSDRCKGRRALKRNRKRFKNLEESTNNSCQRRWRTQMRFVKNGRKRNGL